MSHISQLLTFEYCFVKYLFIYEQNESSINVALFKRNKLRNLKILCQNIGPNKKINNNNNTNNNKKILILNQSYKEE